MQFLVLLQQLPLAHLVIADHNLQALSASGYLRHGSNEHEADARSVFLQPLLLVILAATDHHQRHRHSKHVNDDGHAVLILFVASWTLHLPCLQLVLSALLVLVVTASAKCNASGEGSMARCQQHNKPSIDDAYVHQAVAGSLFKDSLCLVKLLFDRASLNYVDSSST